MQVFHSGADDAAGDVDPGFVHQTHRQCGRVPAARNQLAEESGLRGFRVQVSRLRIVRPRKLDDLFGRDGSRCRCEHRARQQVLEITAHAVAYATA